jgi:hypothetical protein
MSIDEFQNRTLACSGNCIGLCMIGCYREWNEQSASTPWIWELNTSSKVCYVIKEVISMKLCSNAKSYKDTSVNNHPIICLHLPCPIKSIPTLTLPWCAFSLQWYAFLIPAHTMVFHNWFHNCCPVAAMSSSGKFVFPNSMSPNFLHNSPFSVLYHLFIWQQT